MQLTPFLSYYEHLAKLSQVANKKTMFLAYLLSNMVFSKSVRLYIVDITQHLKLEIMKEIAPELKDTRAAINRANQYLQELKKVELIKPMKGLRGTWAFDPMSFSGIHYVSKDLRSKNSKVFLTYQFTRDEVTAELRAYNEQGDEVFFKDGEEFDGKLKVVGDE